MLTKELITSIAAETGMTKKRTEELLNATSQVLLESLCEGKSVQLQGFGVLEAKERSARVIVHPGTGERKVAPAKMQIAFRPTPTMKDEINEIK